MSARGGDTNQTQEPPGVTGTCYQCGGTDHFKEDCPQPNKEVVMEKPISVAPVMTGCQLKLAGHPFEIDLWTTTLSSLANVLDMDWLSRNLAEVMCLRSLFVFLFLTVMC